MNLLALPCALRSTEEFCPAQVWAPTGKFLSEKKCVLAPGIGDYRVLLVFFVTAGLSPDYSNTDRLLPSVIRSLLSAFIRLLATKNPRKAALSTKKIHIQLEVDNDLLIVSRRIQFLHPDVSIADKLLCQVSAPMHLQRDPA